MTVLLVALTFGVEVFGLTCDWIGGVDNNWSTAANWSCGVVPGSADTVTINNSTVILDVDGEVKQFTLLGDNVKLNGSANLTVHDDFRWTDGGVIGNNLGGAIAINGHATLIGPGIKQLDGKQILLNGGGEWNDASMQMLNGAQIVVAADRTLHFTNDVHTTITSSHNSQFINNGTIRRSSISNTHVIQISQGFVNNDSIVIDSGRMEVIAGNFMQGVVLINGTFRNRSSVYSNTEILGDGTLQIVGGLNVINPGTTIDVVVSISNGTFLNNTDLVLNKFFNLTLFGGSFGVYEGGVGSKLTLNGKARWNGGSNMEGSGVVEVNDTFNLVGGAKRLRDSLEVILNHVSIWEGGDFFMDRVARLVNEGEFHIQTGADNAIIKENSSPRLVNNGSIIKQEAFETRFEVHFECNGTLTGIGTLDFASINTSGSGTISPGFSPGVINFDGNLDLDAGLLFELDNTDGPGVGHDLIKVVGQIDISDANCHLSGMMNITDGSYTILECMNGPGCYTGTFDSTYLFEDVRLDFLPDRINVVKGPSCLNTWKVDGLLLSNDPHLSLFEASNKIISNGIISSGENITFDALNGAELIKGFTVESNAEFAVLLSGCVNP